MVAAAASGGAAAQTEAEFVDLFISSAVDAYSAEQRALLRAHAQPEELTVLRGETLGAAVARQCLGADAGYRGDFAKRFYALNPGATVVGGDALLDARLAGSERILAPFCARNSAAKAAAAPRAPAQNGALSLDGVDWATTYGVDWATTSSERVDWGATGWGLPAGKTPPHAGSPWAWPRTWTADAGSQPPIEWWAARVDPQAAPPAPPPETLRVTVPKHVAAQLSRLGGGAPSEEPAAAVSARGSLEVLAAGPRVGECAIGDEPARIGPVDLGRMLRIWAMNAYLRRRKGLTAGLQAPRVFIADSGLLSPSAGGVSLPHLAAPQRAHREYPHARHGLQVASVALGGEALTLYRALMGDAPRLWLFNIVERQSLGGRTRFDVAAHHLKDVLEKARADAAIVSLSVRFPNKDGAPSFDAMLAGGNVLVVAAAGNSGARLGEDGQGHKAYPALFGGSPERPVITVAALRRNGRLAGFSNYGAGHVEIAALGCDVPVWSVDADGGRHVLATASGTSFSAPQVTATAAWLRAHLPGAPARLIKRRILVSADLRPDLIADDAVRDARILNPLKAIASLYADVVETRGADGARRLRIGRLLSPGGPQREAWRVDGRRFGRGFVEKLSRYGEGMLMTPRAGRPERLRGLWSAPRLTLRDPLTGADAEIPTADVVDVVFAHEPYWL